MAQKNKNIEFDRRIGKRIQQLRRWRGMSRNQLIENLHSPICQQQLHKYETGINSLSAWRLYQFAQALNVSVADLLGDHFPKDQNLFDAFQSLDQRTRDAARLIIFHLARTGDPQSSRRRQTDE